MVERMHSLEIFSRHLRECKYIKNIVLFGSQVKGKATEASDVDVFVGSQGEYTHYMIHRHRIKNDIELAARAAGMDFGKSGGALDIMVCPAGWLDNPDEAWQPEVLKRIATEGQVLFDRDQLQTPTPESQSQVLQ